MSCWKRSYHSVEVSKQEHDALVGEAELEVADLADVVDEVLGVVELVGRVVRRGSQVAQLFEEDGDVGFFEDDFAHGDEGRAGGFGVLDEVLPAVGVFVFEDDGGDFFGDVAGKPAHAVACDEGDHVVFERDEVVGLHHQMTIVSEKAR